MSDSDSENKYDNSDEDSSFEKPTIKCIIREKTKIFQNESYAIKVLLSDHKHLRKLRTSFFTNIRRAHGSLYQAIKKEIRNYLNPYRIFIGKDTQIKKEVKELYNLLKNYYKEKNFNNTFFVNYFQNLEKAHKKKNNSKFISNLPKDEIETLNDIQRKVTIIKTLKHYLNTTVRDRLQINFEQKKDLYSKDDFIMMYKYMVIKENKFSLMNEEELMKNLSNKRNAYKFRRPLNDFNIYNYIPILCKGYCQNEAKLFVQVFERSIHNHGPKCKECKQLYENLDEIKKQIKSIYVKTCIFSHNINEIMYHPLVFCSDIANPFYINQFNQKKIPEINEITDIVDTNEIAAKYKNKIKYNIRLIYNPADNDMKEIYNLLREYALKIDLYGNGCYLPEYKTNPCPIDLFQPNESDFSTHMIKCPYYHNSLEKRRNIKIRYNEICKEVIKDGEWRIDENKIKCKNADTCNKFHTRNELFYDQRNFRKLYPCIKKIDPCTKKLEYCLKGEMCPKKHAIDIKIDEIYLPLESKFELEREMKKLIQKYEKFKTKEEKFLKIQCKCCLNYADGTDGRNLYKFINCNHIICSKCIDFYQLCPLCGFNNNYKDEKDKIYIQLDYEMSNIKEKEESENDEEYEQNKEKRKKDDSDGEEGDDGDDNDLKDGDNNTDEDEESQEDEKVVNTVNKQLNDSDEEEEDEDEKNIPEMSMAKELNKSNKKNRNKNSIDEDDEETSRSRVSRGRGDRSRGGRGRGGRGRGGRGRGRGDRDGRGSRGSRARGNRGNNYINNNYSRTNEKENSESSSNSDNEEKEQSSEINNRSKSNKIDDNEKSMEKYANRGRGNQRGKGTIRGRGGRGGRSQGNNFNKNEDNTESSDEDGDEEIFNNSMNNKTKKFNNENNDEESD